ncbi:DUF892 family protein [Pelagicoccus sp. SDUM812002]|uniref:YciE/YciF ferroxidase family protein n=1 Tax=Pelagicoccus sp. SDUM812002 TaxID=3041266 RepID=UPI00280F589F|nr:DUF892 family protein [Pelagicoccus sp. SDUM812002]MDQ8184104.1 DUF892 family protein [Pelagicoccus sp. SDUM812002]
MTDRKVESLESALRDQLRDAYSVECQLESALPKLASLATNSSLSRCFEKHVYETHRHRERLERIGNGRGWDLGGDASKAMQGLIDGGQDHVAEVSLPAARDYLIIAHTRRIELYELAAYRATTELAECLDYLDTVELLKASRREDEAMHESLSRIAREELLDRIPAR